MNLTQEAESHPLSPGRRLAALPGCFLCHKADDLPPWQQESLGNHTEVSGPSASPQRTQQGLCHSGKSR